MKSLQWVLAAVAGCLLVIGGIVTWKVKGEATDPPISTLHERPECGGHDWDTTVPVEQVKDIVDVPEFHDCQRFVVKDGATYKYDKMFAIFVAQTIGGLEQRLGPVQTLPVVPQGGTSTTTVTVPPAGNTAAVPPENNLIAGMVAVVYAEGPYGPLGIEAGLNCLYVWRFIRLTAPPQQTETWSARMVPKGNATSCPDGTVGTIGSGKDLKVLRTQVPGFTNDSDYPPVTKWDWDAAHDKQYVGIKCGAAWCEIYDDALTPSPSLPVGDNDGLDVRRVRLIKGWYDQQFVATFDADHNPVPSRLLATIVPDPKLGQKNDNDFKNHWVHVADISLDAPNSENAVVESYTKKFNFVRTSIEKPVTLEIKWTPGQEFWKARIKRPGVTGWLSLKHKNVKRHTSSTGGSQYDPPGVARWRWMTTDEGTWTRCTVGCCEMSDY